ncbi:MAG TPA: bifunctional DNA-formamidopyrimidine glycosylase/DNA-(apurinic or apyrimidinic site) lyase [Acidimicrobiia bacterium]|nr:bifunctional DNA-formamidopyrimidine glycosylase/DNA-(apurinic or apyrimidinic site) lyase [Acidimicrobiia bacterium]
MPELPEVETVRRYLAPVVEGRRLVDVQVRHPRTGRRNVNPSDVIDRLRGCLVERLDRHGKFLLGRLDSEMVWVTHLGMSGRVVVTNPGAEEALHTHFVARTDDGAEVRLVDPRTFGFVAVFTPDELAAHLNLGRDAFSDLPRTPQLAAELEGRTAPIKSLLLDQRILAGLGNIYADEVLYRARVRPTRPGGSLSPHEMTKLRGSIRPLLEAGIAAGGTSLNDLAYLLPDGRAGEYLDRLRVYGREGQPCQRCGTAIQRVVVGGRSSFFCPQCQV